MPAKENAVASVAHCCAADGKQRLGKRRGGFTAKRWHGFGKFWRVLNSFEAVAAVARGCAADGKQGPSN